MATFLLIGIIWFEKFGLNYKSTLINKLVSFLCQSCIEYFITVSIPDILRVIFGPLPDSICSLELVSKNVYLVQLLIILDAILIAKYLFIFKLKNPLGFNDEFWSKYITLWIRGLSWLPQIVVFLLPGKTTLSWYICVGIEPPDEELPMSKKMNLTFFYSLSALIHLYIPLKIKMFKKKRPVQKIITISSKNYANGKNLEHLINLTSSVITFGLTVMTVLFIMISNLIGPRDISLYPAYLFEYFYRFCWPPFFFFVVAVIYYFRHLDLRRSALDYLKNIFLVA